MVRNRTLAVKVNVLFDQLGNAALCCACARELRPNNAAHCLIRNVAAVIGNLDVIPQAIQNKGLISVLIGAKFRLTVDICVIVAAGFVLNDRHTLD